MQKEVDAIDHLPTILIQPVGANKNYSDNRGGEKWKF